MTPGVVYDYVADIAPSPPPPLKSSRSSGISRSCRSLFRCVGGTQPCTCYIIPSVLVAYMLFSILSTQRGACWIIPTMCFATLLMSNGPRPHPRRSRSCGNSRSFRSVFRFGSGTQRGACCIIPTLCFATLLISNCTAPPTPEEVEVVEIVEVLEICFVLVAVHSEMHVVLYLHCASPVCYSRTVLSPPPQKKQKLWK